MKPIESALSKLRIGEPQLSGTLAAFPLFPEQASPMDYLLLDDALEGDLAQVTEISHSGSVPELAFENRSGRRVLLVDGDELIGARQNRIVNITILVGAGMKLVIPVSCVEQGRWSYRSARFSTAARSLFASAKAKKMAQVSDALRHTGSRASDQGAIWSDIRSKLSERQVASGTSAMADLYDAVEPDLERAARDIVVQPGQSGAVFARGQQVVGLELFDSPEAFARCLPKMVRAYAMDADSDAPGVVDVGAALADVRRFLAEMVAATAEKYAALGEGEDFRFTGDSLAGGALVDGERVVHVAAYRVG